MPGPAESFSSCLRCRSSFIGCVRGSSPAAGARSPESAPSLSVNATFRAHPGGLLGRALALAAAMALSTSANVRAEDASLWRIGTFDESSGEFRAHYDIDYANPTSDPVFRVGKSRAAQDWLRFQPGPANAWTGSRPHPFTVVFDGKGPLPGTLRLRIAMFYETPRLSHLKVELNGHAGLVYFRPKLNYAAGDWEGTFVPNTSMDTKVVELPAAWLRAGENRLVLTALDEPSQSESSFGSISPGHTGIAYDALELLHAPGQAYDANRIEAQLTPTVFYRAGKGASLQQVVEARASFGSMPKQGVAELQVGKAPPLRRTFRSEAEFGEVALEFEVPEWKGAAEARLSIGAADAPHPLPAQMLEAGKKWTVFIIPHEHLDVGFTDYAARVAELHSQSVDEAVAAMKGSPDFRWTLDGSWVVEQYLAGRSPEKQRELIGHLKAGRVQMPLQYASQHTGTASLEGLARSLYDAPALARRHGLKTPDFAQIVDVPSYTWSYATVLREAGVKYFLAASNSWRAPAVLQGRWNERSPFFWEGPDGSRVLMWYSRAYLQMQTLFGAPWRMAAVRDALPVFLQAHARPDYPADSAIIFGSQLENTAFAKEQALIASEFGRAYAWPRLRFAGVGEAMAQIEREAKGRIPVVRGDFGPYWEDGFTSDAAHTALHRQNQSRLLAAEKLGALPALLDPRLRPDATLLGAAWRNQLLFDEHTWTFVGATTQPENEQTVNQIAIKRARTTEAQRQIAESMHRSWGQLASLLSPKDGSLAVFNALSWPRSGLVSFDLPDGFELLDPDSKQPVAVETLWTGQGIRLPGFGGGHRRVRFLASQVPGLGYKLYPFRLAPAAPAAQADARTASAAPGAGASAVPASAAAPSNRGGAAPVLESRFYRVTLDPASGSIASVYDKDLKVELVDKANAWKFGSLLYVTGGDDVPRNSLYRYGAAIPPPQLTVNAASRGRLVSSHTTPFGSVAVLESSAPHVPAIRTELTLFETEKRIELRLQVRKDRVLSREAVYVAFPFAASKDPSFAYASQNGWIDPARDSLPGASREWFAVSQWAAVRGAGFTAAITPLDAPLVAFGDVVRGRWPERFAPASGAILSWLMGNYWGTNFMAWQGGDFSFRYAITSARSLDPAALSRFGWEAMTDLEPAQVQPQPVAAPLPAEASSLLAVDGPGAAVVAWKLAEDGEGSVLRLVETSGSAVRAKVSSRFLTFEKAWRCSLLEERQAALKVAAEGLEVPLRPFEVATIRLQTRPTRIAGHGEGSR